MHISYIIYVIYQGWSSVTLTMAPGASAGGSRDLKGGQRWAGALEALANQGIPGVGMAKQVEGGVLLRGYQWRWEPPKLRQLGERFHGFRKKSPKVHGD